ncbi:heme biosynthesis HemY N-terminal domain-containing protein [Paraglaciecola sp. L3A3]|uniref:heme biosynthesis HemY N-terminal domain-containing protein n=1 Tax=Paraglaciecola sp. L3A3 TaxID=2686358 RepID=UPI00131EA538|nr:heme biosynthesis HemY N-terminal domain-containing protein [Paraglaciecola sp. L3A3]
MIRIFVVLVLLLIALMVGAMVFDDRGYVFVEFSGWVVEMNVFSLAISLIFIFVGFLLINWLVKNALRAASGSRNWFGNWGARKKQKAFTSGLIALAETNYLTAKNHLSKIENEDFDGINLLAAAEIEMQLGQSQQAQTYWRMASTYEKSALAANLCLIRFALNQQQNDEALQLIETLNAKQKEQATVIKLWAQALAQAGKWQVLKGKLKTWKKALGEDYPALMQQASKGSFAEIASKQGAVELKQNWLDQPRATRKDPAQQAAYIQQLIDQGMYADAEQVLVEQQKSGPNSLLVPLFKQIKLPNPTASIRLLESWIKRDELNVDLLSALAHVANASGDKVLAEKALGKAIKLANRQQDLLLMAEIKESQHDDSQALQLYKQSLAQQPR